MILYLEVFCFIQIIIAFTSKFKQQYEAYQLTANSPTCLLFSSSSLPLQFRPPVPSPSLVT